MTSLDESLDRLDGTSRLVAEELIRVQRRAMLAEARLTQMDEAMKNTYNAGFVAGYEQACKNEQ